MSAGHLLKKGDFETETPSEHELWNAFEYVLSTDSKKTTSYKFSFLKSILDNLTNAEFLADQSYYYISDLLLFDKFTEYYWALIVKYHLKQLRGKNNPSASSIETIINNTIAENISLSKISYSDLPQNIREDLVSKVISKCNRYVTGALYKDLGGLVYSFNKDNMQGILLSLNAYNFMVKYRKAIEIMNYYAWAKFLEDINQPEDAVNVLSKLESAASKMK